MLGALLRRLSQPFLCAIGSDRKEHAAAMTLVAFTGGLLHLFFLIYFFINAAFPLVWINVGSCCLYVVAEILITKNKQAPASVLMSVEACAYALLNVWLLGWACGAQWLMLLALLPHYLFSSISSRLRVLLTLLVGVTINLSLVVDLLTTPALSVENFSLLQFVHLNIVLFCVMMELAINDVQRLIVSSRAQQHLRMIQEEAMLDPLTKLHNRRYMDQCFHSWLEDMHRKVVFVILDLDDFSKINDAHNHFVGDQALSFFADTLRTQFRQTDLRVRWGGDEFLLVLPGISEQGAWMLMEKLAAYLAETPYGQAEDGTPLHLSFSAGVSAYDEAQGVIGVMRQCDQSMYKHKREKKKASGVSIKPDGVAETAEGA